MFIIENMENTQNKENRNFLKSNIREPHSSTIFYTCVCFKQFAILLFSTPPPKKWPVTSTTLHPHCRPLSLLSYGLFPRLPDFCINTQPTPKLCQGPRAPRTADAQPQGRTQSRLPSSLQSQTPPPVTP